VRVLLVEDNYDLSASLGEFLAAKDCDVDFAYNGQSCLTLTQENEYDIIVLDIAMPGINGIETCKRLRQNQYNATPIIFLTARDTLNDKIQGFEAGCDDYLVKPFAPEELLYRLEALNQRGPRRNVGVQELGEICIDHRSQQVMRQDKVIKLHEIQFRILVILSKNAPNLVTKETLEKALWGEEAPESDPLRTHIYRLRTALDKPFDKELIKTVHGKGYCLVTTPTANTVS